VKPSTFAYHDPRSSDDLMALLARLDNAKLLAGGQSLMPMLAGLVRIAGCRIRCDRAEWCAPRRGHPVSPENILEWLKTTKT
jgi:carbon-monoxide dehydrogenase medium subunit